MGTRWVLNMAHTVARHTPGVGLTCLSRLPGEPFQLMCLVHQGTPFYCTEWCTSLPGAAGRT